MSDQFVTCALYKFVTLPNFEALREPLLERYDRRTMCLAHCCWLKRVLTALSPVPERELMRLAWLGAAARPGKYRYQRVLPQ